MKAKGLLYTGFWNCLLFFVLAESGASNNERSLEEISASFLCLLLVSK